MRAAKAAGALKKVIRAKEEPVGWPDAIAVRTTVRGAWSVVASSGTSPPVRVFRRDVCFLCGCIAFSFARKGSS
jgi:hypothetical protein